MYSSITGYLAPDELWYFNTYILGGQPIPSGYREVFLGTFLLFFKGSSNVPDFLFRGTIYCTLWGAGSVVVAYKILGLMKLREIEKSLAMFSLPLIPVFSLFVPLIITETMGLFFALIGVYFMIRFVLKGNAISALLASIFFIMAYKVREPYLLMAFGSLLAVLLSGKRSVKAFFASAIPLSLFFPVPISYNPLVFANPVYAYFINWLQSFTMALNPNATSNVNILTPAITVPYAYATPLNALRAFLIGLFYGYNPLFTLFIFASMALSGYVLVKRHSALAGITLLTMVLALSSFGVSDVIAVSSYMTTTTATIIRYSHTAMPSIFGIGLLYKRIKPRYVGAMLIILTVAISTQVPVLRRPWRGVCRGLENPSTG